MKIILFFVLCMFVSLASAIQNGTPLVQDDLDKTGTVALVFMNTNQKLYKGCTGIRIAPQLVLSATHCVDGKPPLGITANLDRDVSNLEEIESYKIFPEIYFRNYIEEQNQSYLFDLVIIKLKKPYYGTILPLAKLSDIHKPEQLVQLGFGQNSDRHFTYWPIPGLLTNGTISHKVYADNNLGIFNLYSSTRSGDSGGPLLIKTPQGYKILGILTKGVGLRSPDTDQPSESIYENLLFYHDWITSGVDQTHP